MVRREIAKLIERSIKKLQKDGVFPKFDLPEIQTEHAEEKAHGDYSTNVALKIGKIIKKDPMEIAEKIGKELRAESKALLEKVEAVPPGFINFFLSKEYLQKEIKEILKKGENFGQLNIGKNLKTNIEFISANPTGLLHLGNGRGAFFGDCLANVLEKAGYKVIREYYTNDAKANTQIKILGKTALGRGTTYLTKDLELKIKKLKPKLKRVTNEGEAGYLLVQNVQKDIRNFIEKKLKIKFDNWVSEEDFYRKSKIKKAYQFLKKKGLVYRKEGAEWLKISKFNAPKDEVILRQTGEPTYFLSDIAYHQDKFTRGFGKIINIWGADHQGHVPKIKAISKILDYRGELDILISQMVRLKKGKISKRKGEIITLESLVDEISLDAARFFYLMKSLNTQMEFDVELAKERSAKSPVYYVQYAHARICSILRKSKNKKQKTKNKNCSLFIAHCSLLGHPSELTLIKELIRFPEIIEDTAKDYQVQRIPQYAIDLATSFHQFYRDCKVLSEVEGLREARLALILVTKIVLKNTLNLMGISAPERM